MEVLCDQRGIISQDLEVRSNTRIQQLGRRCNIRAPGVWRGKGDRRQEWSAGCDVSRGGARVVRQGICDSPPGFSRSREYRFMV